MLPLQQFTAYIKTNALFFSHEKVLLAVSGGKDSVLMAQLFKLAGYQFSIAHCNFNLRAAESQRDEAFVKLLAAQLEVPCYTVHFNTAAYAAEHRMSAQMAARELRYSWFEKIRTEIGYDHIALAHHQNDSVETVLLNLVRGTGISGMHGILPKREKLIRPLLFLSRHEIDTIVDENNLDFVTDSSNETTKYARNSIRVHVIPRLRALNPNLEETFARNTVLFAQTEEVLQQVVAQKRTEVSMEKNGMVYFSIPRLRELHPAQLLLFELLKPYHFSYPVVEELLNSLQKQSGTSFYSSTHRATINREEVIISTLSASAENEHQFIQVTDRSGKIGEKQILISYSNSTVIAADPNSAYVDAAQLIFPLVLRFKQNGDRFMPLGMKNYQKLSDFLIHQKIPLPEKDKIPLLINGNGELIWVAGLRQDNRYKVTATTKKVAIFELLNP